jgi:DNA polymerase-3 subunit gamma/tau
MTIALARRYRPKRFSDLIAQEHVAAVLRGAIRQKRVGHGYLLTGPRGVGKTTAARILAMALNCERVDPEAPQGEPCGECPSCLRIWNGSANLDVVEIDAASNRGVDDARELRERAMYAASQEGHHKVYIVDEAHMLTREAWNALLKVLEEPPESVVFVFATTEPHKIANTAAPVMSRLQRFDFKRIGPSAIQQRLTEVLAVEKIEADADATLLIAQHADGGMRDALSVLDQCLSFGEGALTAGRVREVLGLAPDDVFADLLSLLAERDPASVFGLIERMVEAGADLTEFMSGAAEVLRAVLKAQVGAPADGLTEMLQAKVAEVQDRLSAGDVLRMLGLLAESEASIKKGGSPRLQVETLLLRWTMMDRIVDLRQVLEGGAETPGGSDHPTRAPAPRKPVRRSAPTAPAREAAEPPPGDAGAPDPSPGPTSAPASPIPFTVEALSAHWHELIEAAGHISRFLAKALAATAPREVAPPLLRLGVTDQATHVDQPLARNKGPLERLIAERVGQPVTVELMSDVPVPEPTSKPKRYSEERVRQERLEAHRANDPALDTAAKELDLEVME